MVSVFFCIGVAIPSCLVPIMVPSVHQATTDMVRIPYNTLCGLGFGFINSRGLSNLKGHWSQHGLYGSGCSTHGHQTTLL